MLIADADGKSGQIAAGDLPFVVLLGEDCPNETPDRSPVREDVHDVGASPYLLVEALLGVVRSVLPPEWATGKAVKGRIFGPPSASSSAAWGKALVEHLQYARVLRVDLLRRWLLVDGRCHVRHPRLVCSGCLSPPLRCRS